MDESEWKELTGKLAAGMAKRLTPEREKDIRTDYVGTRVVHTDVKMLLAEIDALRAELEIAKKMVTSGTSICSAMKDERDRLREALKHCQANHEYCAVVEDALGVDVIPNGCAAQAEQRPSLPIHACTKAPENEWEIVPAGEACPHCGKAF